MMEAAGVNRRQFQADTEQARKRAIELGEAGNTGTVSELVTLCRHPGPTVRRAAASALGKLATDEAGVTVERCRNGVTVLIFTCRDGATREGVLRPKGK